MVHKQQFLIKYYYTFVFILDFFFLKSQIHFIACKPGYYGSLCNIPCPSGDFGRNCAGRCLPMCPVEECDMVLGCPKTTENIITMQPGL